MIIKKKKYNFYKNNIKLDRSFLYQNIVILHNKKNYNFNYIIITRDEYKGWDHQSQTIFKIKRKQQIFTMV